MLGDFVELLQEASGIIPVATLYTNTNRYMLKNIEHCFPAQIDGHAALSYVASAFFTSVVFHGLFRKDGNDSERSGFCKAANEVDFSSVDGTPHNNELTAITTMPLSLSYSTRINRIFHVYDRKSILLHFVFRMSGKLVLAKCDFSPELVDF